MAVRLTYSQAKAAIQTARRRSEPREYWVRTLQLCYDPSPAANADVLRSLADVLVRAGRIQQPASGEE